MKKKFIYLLLSSWLLTPLGVFANNEVKFLSIELRNGTTAEFALADRPVITLTGGIMKAATAGKTITASLSDVVRYTFKTEGGTTGIEDDTKTQSSQPQSVFEEGHVRFTNLPARAPISVVTIDGRLVLKTQAGTDGRADIDLSQQHTGIYILRTPTISIKVFNKH